MKNRSKQEWEECIPFRFRNAKVPAPVVRTVGELKAALAELPDDLDVKVGLGDMAEVVVYNVSSSESPHMELRPIDESDFECDIDDDWDDDPECDVCGGTGLSHIAGQSCEECEGTGLLH